MKKYMALDTETSGFEPGQICQLSYVIFNENFKAEKAFNQFFKVDSVEEGAEKVHGFSVDKLELLSKGSIFKDVVGEVIQDLSIVEKVFVHNAQFDLKFMGAELQRLGITFNFKSFCTMNYYTKICELPGKVEGQFKWPRLSEVLEYHSVPSEFVLTLTKEMFGSEEVGFHDARYDVAGLFVICEKMKNK